MRRIARFILLGTALYSMGLTTGIAITLCLVYHHGEEVGARIIAIGVRLANSGINPEWTVAINQDIDTARQPKPTEIAKKGK